MTGFLSGVFYFRLKFEMLVFNFAFGCKVLVFLSTETEFSFLSDV